MLGVRSILGDEDRETMPKPPKYIRNSGKPWNADDIKNLRQLAKEDTPTGVIGLKLGRTVASVYKKASAEGISLMPSNPRHKRKENHVRALRK